MGTLGTRFIDVTERLRTALRAPSGAELTTWLQALLDQLGMAGPDGPPGGFLCLPSGPVVLGIPPRLGSGQPLLRVPRHVTLWFPPGAWLVFPEGRAGLALEVEGALEATLQQLFARHDPLDGLVRFGTPPPAGIFPEWFGAGLVPGGDDASALQAALRCAIDSSQHSQQTVVVELLRKYLL
jgi:hypothetical protein